MSAIDVISNIIGWIYFTAWSLSFYGQLYENYRLKSVEGYKLDFQVLNLTGFFFYTYVNSVGYFWESTNPYNNYGLGTVQIQDFLFAAHALLIVIITGVQCLIYPRGKNKVSNIGWGLTVGFWFLAILFAFLFYVKTRNYFILRAMPFPQVIIGTSLFSLAYWNYKRKSTVGWSIINVALDFTGGFFSILQTILDLQSGQSDTINPIKFALGNISMVFDMLFAFQHYVLYNDARKSDKIYGNSNLVDQEYRKIASDSDSGLYTSGPLNRTYD